MIDMNKFQYFLDKARIIVAEHRAQYSGVYYMKGGFLGKVLNSPITQILSDVVAVATGNPELIPLINAGESTAGHLAKGDSLGKSLGQGLLSGGEAFAGQELLGAAANAFPETGAALGLDTSGNTLTDLFGSTTGAGSFAGPGTIGGDIAGLFSGSPAAGIGSLAPIDSSTGMPISTPTAGAGMSLGSIGSLPSSAIDSSAGTPFSAPSGDIGSSMSVSLSPSAPSGATIQSASGNTLPASAATTSPGVGGVNGLTAPGSGGASVGAPSASPVVPAGVPLDISGTDFLQGQEALYPMSVGETASNAPSIGGSMAMSSADRMFLKNASDSSQNTNASGSIVQGGSTPPVSSGKAFLDNPGLSTLGGLLTSNLGPLVSAGGLAASAMQGNKPVKGENQVNQAAANATASGNALQQYLPSGTLPPGVQASINQAANSQKAAIKSRFARQGSSGSSAEQSELAAVDQWAQGQASSVAMQLLNSGIQQSALGAGLYQDISKNALAQDQSLASSIANFASSLAGGTVGTGSNGYKLVAA